ncbi:MAG TPA: hypothetical protein VK021_05560 [Flavobacteriaceae bacterium]|nr:hypothetical protein [Flavobacteriaceae bacterium]
MKKFIRVLLIVVLIIVLGIFSVQFFVDKKINTALKNMENKGEITYKDYNLNLFAADFSIDSLTYFSGDNSFFVEKLKIHNIGLTEYVANKNINVGNLKLKKPTVTLIKKTKMKSAQKNKDFKVFNKSILVDDIEIEKATLIYKEDTLTKLKLKNYNIGLRKIKVDSQSLKKTIPFEYDHYNISGGKLYYLLNNLQTFTTESVNIKQDEVVLSNLRLIPNYSRKEYVKVIPYEKDLMDLKMGSLTFHNYKFDLDAKRNLLDIHKVKMDNIDFDIYRNKLVRDDPRKKKMYSGMLRDLPFDLNIDSLQVRNADLTYEEVQEKTEKTGKVFFTKMNVEVNSLTNLNMQRKDFPETVVDIDCQLMGQAPLNVSWTFKVNQPEDNFQIKGKGLNIPPKSLNSFFEPAFNMNASGENIKAIYFNFYGDKLTAQGEYHMVYDDLKIEVLKKNKDQQKNKLLSFFANLFVNHKNDSGDKVIEVSDVQRNPTRSFWNYFWKCIFEGLRKTLI